MTLRHSIPGSLALGALLCAGPNLTTRYEAGAVVRVETLLEFTMETTEFSMEVDGEPVDGPMGRAGGQASSESRTIAFTDSVLEAADGLPHRVRRAFEHLDAAGKTSFGDEAMEHEREGPLTGVTLELTRDEDGDVAVDVVEGDEPDDDALLEGHRLGLALDALLPEDGVAVGDSWSIDSDDVRRALGWDLQPVLFPRPEREEAEGGRGERGGGGGGGGFRGGRGGGSSAQLFAEAEWDATATLVADDESGEHGRVARIELVLKASGDLPEREFGGGGFGRGRALGLPRAPLAPANTYEIELEGELLFSLDQGRPVYLELEGEVITESNREMDRGDRLLSISTTREGTYRQTVSLTNVDSE